MACGSTSSNLVSPEDVRGYKWPSQNIVFASLEERLLDSPVLPFDNPVCLRVVSRDANMMNAILACQPVQSLNISRTIVCHNLLNGTPSAEDVFKNEAAKGRSGLCAKGAPFWPGSEQAVGLDDVVKASGRSHEHGIDIYLAEEGSGSRDARGNADFGGLLELTLMTGTDVPLDVLIDGRPPEAVSESVVCGIEALVAEVVVDGMDDGEASGGGNEELVAAGGILSPESSTQ